ncbi:MAG: hypothetical protein AAB438_00120 [Patescibacteria group bacterium]
MKIASEERIQILEALLGVFLSEQSIVLAETNRKIGNVAQRIKVTPEKIMAVIGPIYLKAAQVAFKIEEKDPKEL